MLYAALHRQILLNELARVGECGERHRRGNDRDRSTRADRSPRTNDE
jgi:hypothetical protein